MKTYVTVALAAPLLAAAHGGGGYGGQYGRRGMGMPYHFGCGYGDGGGCGMWGGNGCASSCFSSYWEKQTATPTPTAFCQTGSELHSCIESACSANSESQSSYSSRSSSLCSELLSCSSTGTYTYTYETPDSDWPFGYHDGSSTHTWPTGEVTVTGCPWNGDGWGFPFWHGLGYGSDFWNNPPDGWATKTITTTITGTGGSGTSIATLEQAVSDDTTTFRTLAADSTGTDENSPGESTNVAPGGLNEVKMMGAALGAVVAVAGML